MEKVIKKKIDEIIRVNHAGEYGAQRIYSGQIKFCKKDDLKKELKRIIKEEYEHYEFFNEEMINRRTRPTLLSPVWHYGGYFLGVFTSIIGEKYVHACTEAVEEVIVEHYEEQIKFLEQKGVENKLLKKIKKFRADEDDHRHFAENSNMRQSGVKLFKRFTRELTKFAIKVSKKY